MRDGDIIKELSSGKIYTIIGLKRKYFNVNLSFQEYNVIIMKDSDGNVNELPDFICIKEFEVVHEY